jgi:hypothetical protein
MSFDPTFQRKQLPPAVKLQAEKLVEQFMSARSRGELALEEQLRQQHRALLVQHLGPFGRGNAP